MQKQLKNIARRKFNKDFNKREFKPNFAFDKSFYKKKLEDITIGTFKKTLNNFFITIINGKGEVILTQSAGNCQIKTKKKKRSFDTVKTIAASIAKAALIKNIKSLDVFYVTHRYLKNMFLIVNTFRFGGLATKHVLYIRKKKHSLPMKKRKIRRL